MWVFNLRISRNRSKNVVLCFHFETVHRTSFNIFYKKWLTLSRFTQILVTIQTTVLKIKIFITKQSGGKSSVSGYMLTRHF